MYSDASARPLPRLTARVSPLLTPDMSLPPPPRPQAAPSTIPSASPSPTGSPRGACLLVPRRLLGEDNAFPTLRPRRSRTRITIRVKAEPSFFLFSGGCASDGPPSGSLLTRLPSSSDPQIRRDPRHIPRRARETAHRARGVQGASSVLPRARARRNTPIVQSEASKPFRKTRD